MKRKQRGPSKLTGRMPKLGPQNKFAHAVCTINTNDVVVSSGTAFANTEVSVSLSDVAGASYLAQQLCEVYQYVRIKKVEVRLDPQVKIFDGVVGVSGLAQGHFAHRIITTTFNAGWDHLPGNLTQALDEQGSREHRPNATIVRTYAPYVQNVVQQSPAGALQQSYMLAPWFGTQAAAGGFTVRHYCGHIGVEPPSASGTVAGITQKYRVRLRVELEFKKARGTA